MWSSQTIQGRSSVTILNLTENAKGWETDYCRRIAGSFTRTGIPVTDSGNCLLVFGTPDQIKKEWSSLQEEKLESAKLFAATTWEDYDPDLSQDILSRQIDSIPFRIVQQSPVTPREAGLFYLKFFTELNLHSPENLSGKMVWFSASKARELLRKRRYQAKFGWKC